MSMQMDKTIKEKAQAFALSFFLSDYYPALPYEETLQALEDGDESVVVWEVFENKSADWLISHIEDMVEGLVRTFEDEPLSL